MKTKKYKEFTKDIREGSEKGDRRASKTCIRTCVLHPASATHRQLSDEQLFAAGINPGMIRFSVGLENIDDILEDIDQSLAQV